MWIEKRGWREGWGRREGRDSLADGGGRCTNDGNADEWRDGCMEGGSGDGGGGGVMGGCGKCLKMA